MSTTFRDEELGVALRQLEVPEHRPEFHAELRRLLAHETFSLAFPAAAEPNDLEHGFGHVEPAQIGQVVGYDPLVPAWLPEGYRPAEVAVDPGEGYRDRPERVILGRGTLSGVEAKLLLVPRNVPHLWALGDELVVTVSGELGRAELVRVAESLEAGP